MATTKVFTLTTGVECEIEEMNGLHKEELTKNGGANFYNALELILQDCIVRVGSVEKPDRNFILNMLSADRKQCLTEIACFTMGYTDKFSFEYEYISKLDNKRKVEIIDLDITNGFPIKPLQVIKNNELVDANYEEYSDIQKEFCTLLPVSGKKIFWTVLTGANDKKFANISKEERNVYLHIRKRMPYYLHKTEKGSEVKITVDNHELRNLKPMDSNELTKDIKKIEPDFNTYCYFEHPESGAVVHQDITELLSFFFPSGIA